MAEEEVVAASSPPASEHKRKFEDLEAQAPEPPTAADDSNLNSHESEEDAITIAADSESKRARLDEKPDALAVTENGHQSEPNKRDLEPNKGDLEQPTVESDGKSQVPEEAPPQDVEGDGQLQQTHVENPEMNQTSGEELLEPPSAEDPQHVDASSAEQQQPEPESETTSRKMEVPNNKVGVLIGKAGDTIRYLQYNSGAKIQITRDADADPNCGTRPVELIGSLESINKAEKLIKDVIAEADAGGSPSLVARGFNSVQTVGVAEQLQIQVPNEKVGLIIGKGGETIKNLQTRSGARIQLIPQHLPEGDQSKDRTVRVTGDKKQIEIAREMIKEVMNQTVRPTALSSAGGGYNQQNFRPRGPPPMSSQWGPRGHHPSQPSGYDYQQQRGPGPYPSQNQQYPPHAAYGNYPPQQVAARGGGSFGQGWEQRPPAKGPPPPPQSGGYDYYGNNAPAAASNPHHHPTHGSSVAPVMGGPNHPSSQANYNYAPASQGPDYGQQQQQPPYGQQNAPPPSQGGSYGHGYGYGEAKYENQQAPHPVQQQQQHSYGGGYQHSSYGHPQQDQHSGYGKPPPSSSYGGVPPPQGPPPSSQSSYGGLPPPRGAANQPQPGVVGEVPPYQGGPISTTTQQQTYQNMPPPQQAAAYPYAPSGGAMQQQSYPQYGSAPVATDGGYSQPPQSGYPQQQPVTSGGYGQQQPVTSGGYGQQQPGGVMMQQPPSGYAPMTAAYGAYPPQPVGGGGGYATDQNAAYGGGYQGGVVSADPGYGGAAAAYGAPPPSAQPGAYAQQPAPTQQQQQPPGGGYEQSVVPQVAAVAAAGGYGPVPGAGAAAAAYVKGTSPQPGYSQPQQYDASQMYGAHR